MRRITLSCLLFLIITTAKAQLAESFTDGNFTDNPAWTGGTADFTVNTSLQLQSNNTTASSTYYLSTANTLATSAEWDFYVKLAFATSSTNYTDIFLTASASDLTASGTTGYAASISAPPAYKGCWGPGTLVTTRLNHRFDMLEATRAPRACIVGGANPARPASASAPTA